MFHIEVDQNAVKKLEDLGSEGYFYPKVQSSPTHECMIIDMTLLFDITCDVSADAVIEVLAPYVDMDTEVLVNADYIYVKWEV